MLDQLTHDSFAKHVHSEVRVLVGSGAVGLVLLEVSELRTSAHTEAFSLVFRGPTTVFLPQAEYRFEHGELGVFSLFIVPIGSDSDGIYYEALFNQLRPEIRR